MWSLMLWDSVDWMMKTARAQSAMPTACTLHRSGSRTILVTHALADGDAALVVGVLQDHDLGQLNAEAVGHQLGELAVAVASEELDRVGRHGRPWWCVVGEDDGVSWWKASYRKLLCASEHLENDGGPGIFCGHVG